MNGVGKIFFNLFSQSKNVFVPIAGLNVSAHEMEAFYCSNSVVSRARVVFSEINLFGFFAQTFFSTEV